MPAGQVSPERSVAEALARWRAGNDMPVLRTDLLVCSRRCPIRGIGVGSATH
jgi:hypothetical protein